MLPFVNKKAKNSCNYANNKLYLAFPDLQEAAMLHPVTIQTLSLCALLLALLALALPRETA
jgi:hypothetical protein